MKRIYKSDYTYARLCDKCGWLELPHDRLSYTYIGICPKCGDERTFSKIGRFTIEETRHWYKLWVKEIKYVGFTPKTKQ